MGGISLPLGSSTALFGLGQIRTYVSPLGQDATILGSALEQREIHPYRPPQWSKPSLYMITIPAPYVQTPATSQNSSNPTNPNQSAGSNAMQVSVGTLQQPPNTAPGFLLFDGVMRDRQSQRARPTRLPVQVQSNMSDHVMLDPATITMDIMMTDVLPARVEGQWVGNPSKSISCFQVLDSLRAARVPLTLTTRLKTYTNVFLVDIIPDETVKTRYAFKAQLEFEQVFIATVGSIAYSARPQTTGDTSIGTTQTVPPSSGVISQNGLPSASTGVPSSIAAQQKTGVVQGAGNWSSNNTAAVNNLLSK